MKIVLRLISYMLVAITFSGVSQGTDEPSLIGHWEGALVHEGYESSEKLDFKPAGSQIAGTMTMPDVGMFKQPLTNVGFHSPAAHFEPLNLAAIFDGELKADAITGKLEVIGVQATFYLHRSTEEALPYRQEEVRFVNGPVTLRGTLTLPLGGGKHPAIVFTHGGGPDTRDLSRFYADLFARKGIASLIYDKRGVGASAPELDWGRASFSDLAGDALAGVRLLQGRREVDGRRIGLYGPSNGAWVVEYAAARSQNVAFMVVISGGGIPAWESEVYRVEAQARDQEFSEDEVHDAVKFMQQKFAVARSGEGWEDFQKVMDQSRSKRWFHLVNAPGSLERLREAWSGQFSYDPFLDLQKLRIPVLGIFGALDTETPALRIAARTADGLKAR